MQWGKANSTNFCWQNSADFRQLYRGRATFIYYIAKPKTQYYLSRLDVARKFCWVSTLSKGVHIVLDLRSFSPPHSVSQALFQILPGLSSPYPSSNFLPLFYRRFFPLLRSSSLHFFLQFSVRPFLTSGAEEKVGWKTNRHTVLHVNGTVTCSTATLLANFLSSRRVRKNVCCSSCVLLTADTASRRTTTWTIKTLS